MHVPTDCPLLPEGWGRSLAEAIPYANQFPSEADFSHLWHPSGMRNAVRIAFRWCRFAQPPANGFHPSGMRDDPTESIRYVSGLARGEAELRG